MVRIAICEDNRDDCHTLNNLLTDFFAERAKPCSVQVFESGETLLYAFRQADFDICLIDLLLPGMDGMETARRIRSLESACSIIFTTITDAYAISGYSVAAVAYLLKPIVPKDLAAALLRCPSVAPKPPEARLSLTELDLDVPVRSVRYVEGFGNRLIVHTVGHAISGYLPLYTTEPVTIDTDGHTISLATPSYVLFDGPFAITDQGDTLKRDRLYVAASDTPRLPSAITLLATGDGVDDLSLTVTWTADASAAQLAEPGTYTITGTLDLPDALSALLPATAFSMTVTAVDADKPYLTPTAVWADGSCTVDFFKNPESDSTITLYVSYDDGATWQVMAPFHDANDRHLSVDERGLRCSSACTRGPGLLSCCCAAD